MLLGHSLQHGQTQPRGGRELQADMAGLAAHVGFWPRAEEARNARDVRNHGVERTCANKIATLRVERCLISQWPSYVMTANCEFLRTIIVA